MESLSSDGTSCSKHAIGQVGSLIGAHSLVVISDDMVTMGVALPALIRADNLLPSIASHVQAASLLVHLDALGSRCTICTSEVAIFWPIIVARGLASIAFPLMCVIVH